MHIEPTQKRVTPLFLTHELKASWWHETLQIEPTHRNVTPLSPLHELRAPWWPAAFQIEPNKRHEAPLLLTHELHERKPWSPECNDRSSNMIVPQHVPYKGSPRVTDLKQAHGNDSTCVTGLKQAHCKGSYKSTSCVTDLKHSTFVICLKQAPCKVSYKVTDSKQSPPRNPICAAAELST